MNEKHREVDQKALEGVLTHTWQSGNVAHEKNTVLISETRFPLFSCFLRNHTDMGWTMFFFFFKVNFYGIVNVHGTVCFASIILLMIITFWCRQCDGCHSSESKLSVQRQEVTMSSRTRIQIWWLGSIPPHFNISLESPLHYNLENSNT